ATSAQRTGLVRVSGGTMSPWSVRRLASWLLAACARVSAAATIVAGAVLALGPGLPVALQAQRPEILDRARIDPDAGVNFQALVTPDTVWLGEQVNYQVGVFMDEDIRSRLRRNPEFMPPELRSML